MAASLDGYIAGYHGEFDWIPEDPTIDFGALFGRIDTVLLGRRSYETVLESGGEHPWPVGSRVFVFSRTLRQDAYPDVTVVADGAARVVAALRNEAGDGEIWLFGGGALFKSLLAERQVDVVEVAVVPILLGGGVPLLPEGSLSTRLKLTGTKGYPSGIVLLTYAVQAES